MVAAALIYLGATTDPFILGVVTTALGGGAISALAAFKRTKPQGQLDIANAAKVLYDQLENDNVRLRGETERLTSELERSHSTNEDLHQINEHLLSQLGHCNDELKALRAERDRS